MNSFSFSTGTTGSHAVQCFESKYVSPQSVETSFSEKIEKKLFIYDKSRETHIYDLWNFIEVFPNCVKSNNKIRCYSINEI